MFKKLLSNLPFNPSLIGQVSFYAKRVRREAVVRRAGLIILALAVALQTFAIISPPQASLANSNNDLVVGGFNSPSEAASYCQQNVRGYQTILAYYSISCDNVAAGTETTLKSNAFNGQLYSMGYIAYGKAGETPINIPGVGTVYMRYLSAWDQGSTKNYRALKITNTAGTTYYLLYSCGNLVSIGLPPAPKPPEEPKGCENGSTLPGCAQPCEYNSLIATTNSKCKPCTAAQTRTDLTACLLYNKTVSNLTQSLQDANNTIAKPGDTLRYTLTTKNEGKTAINDYVITENISDVLDYATVITLNDGTLDEKSVLSWPAANIAAGATVTKIFDVTIKDPIPETPISSSDPGHFDLAITNVYGNTTTVKLPASVLKTTEVAITKLPNTGPGTTISLSFIMIAFIGYFFARSRLIAKELDIVKSDFGGNGQASA